MQADDVLPADVPPPPASPRRWVPWVAMAVGVACLIAAALTGGQPEDPELETVPVPAAPTTLATLPTTTTSTSTTTTTTTSPATTTSAVAAPLLPPPPSTTAPAPTTTTRPAPTTTTRPAPTTTTTTTTVPPEPDPGT